MAADILGAEQLGIPAILLGTRNEQAKHSCKELTQLRRSSHVRPKQPGLVTFLVINAVFFDLDDTLLDRERFLCTQHDRLSALQHIPRQHYASRFADLDARGRVWKDCVYQALVSEFSVSGLSWRDLLEDYEAEFGHCCIPFPDLLPTITSLHAAGYRLGIISNGRALAFSAVSFARWASNTFSPSS